MEKITIVTTPGSAQVAASSSTPAPVVVKRASPDETVAMALEAVQEPARLHTAAAKTVNALPPAATEKPREKTGSTGAYIQISAEVSEAAALDKLIALLKDGVNASIEDTIIDGQAYYRVLIGPYDTKEQAANDLPRFKAHPLAGGAPFVKAVR